MINHGCNYEFKARGDTNDKLREYLVDEDVGEHESESKHHRNIENAHKILIRVQAKNPVFDVERKLIATEEVSERYQVESQENIVDVQVSESRHFRDTIVLVKIVACD